MREYSTILREAGLTTPGPDGAADKLQIEHVFVVTLGENLERMVHKLVDTTLLLSLNLIRALKVLSYASSAFLLLYGTSKLIQAIQGNASSPGSTTDPKTL